MKILGKVIERVHKTSMPVPFRGKVDVKVGKEDSVKPGTLLFSRSLKKIKRSYYLPKELGVSINKAHEYIARLDGEYVTPGEVLAERLAGGGLLVRKIHASDEGIMSLQRLDKGYIDILDEVESIELKADFRGTVEKIDMSNGMYIETSIWRMPIAPVLKASRDEFTSVYVGQFESIGDGSSIYVAKDLKDNYAGKIVFAGRFVYPDLVRELYGRGAELVVAYAMDYDDYISLTDPVVLLGGFGNVSFDGYWEKSVTSMFGSFCVVDLGRRYILWPDNGQFMNKNPYEPENSIVAVLKPGMEVMSVDVEELNKIGKIIEMEDEGFATVEFNDGSRRLLSTDVLQPVYA